MEILLCSSSWIPIVLVILLLGCMALGALLEEHTQDWHVRAFCTKCGWSHKPHGGDKWFTEQHFPVCPRCGDDSGYETKTARYIFLKLVIKEKEIANERREI